LLSLTAVEYDYAWSNYFINKEKINYNPHDRRKGVPGSHSM
jgi:hypothetical protein